MAKLMTEEQKTSLERIYRDITDQFFEYKHHETRKNEKVEAKHTYMYDKYDNYLNYVPTRISTINLTKRGM